MNDKPSQAFLDREIGKVINGWWGTSREPSKAAWMARIERLLAAEQHRVALECVSLFADHENCCNVATIASRIRARFPAPKEEPST